MDYSALHCIQVLIPTWTDLVSLDILRFHRAEHDSIFLEGDVQYVCSLKGCDISNLSVISRHVIDQVEIRAIRNTLLADNVKHLNETKVKVTSSNNSIR